MTLQRILGIELPVIQAPMAGVQGNALAVAVSNAGGLGSLPCAMLSPDAMRNEQAAIRAQASKPFNVNFFCHAPPTPGAEREAAWRATLAPYYKEYGIDVDAIPVGPGRMPFSSEAADVLDDFKPAVVSFHFGLPSAELLARVRAWGAKILSSATTVEEARWLEAHGVNAIIAQGLEAGGHRGMFLSNALTSQVGTIALLPQMVRAVKLPVMPPAASRMREVLRLLWRSAQPAYRSGRLICSAPRPPRALCIARRSRARPPATRRSRTFSQADPPAES